jgi:hypothetical protein
MRAHLFPFLSVKTQSCVCFTDVSERICSVFVHFYEHTRQLSAHTRAHMQRPLAHPRAAAYIRLNIRACVCTCISIYLYIYPYIFFFFHDSCLPNSLLLLDTGLFIWRTTSCSARRSMPRRGAHYMSTQAPSRARPSHGQWSLAAAPSAATTPVRLSSARAPAPRKVVDWIFPLRVSRRCRPTLSKI